MFKLFTMEFYAMRVCTENIKLLKQLEYVDFLTTTHLQMNVQIIPHGILCYESLYWKY